MPRSLAALSLLLFALLGACAATDSSSLVIPAAQGGEVVVAEGLKNEIEVIPPEPEDTWGGLVSVGTTIRSLSRTANLGIRWRYEFFDDRGRALKPVDDWAFSSLHAGDSTSLKGSSHSSRVDSWRLTLQRVDAGDLRR